MIFTAPSFLIFLLIVFSIYWALPQQKHRNHFLILASSIFYGWWDIRFLGLLYLTTMGDYAFAKKISGESCVIVKKRWLRMSLISNLLVLGVFKYFNFFASSAQQAFQAIGISLSAPTLQIILPVGISFYTFQSLSYVIDVYRGHLRADISFPDFLMYVIFFPQLVAGPIVRATDFIPQLPSLKNLDTIAFKRCFFLFAVGYFKKVIVGDNLAGTIDPVFSSPHAFGYNSNLLAAVGYSFQIYCDFSGYTDMAMGTAGLFGYTLCKNFDAPYWSTNIQDFWRRWHISLSSWLKDYLYIPLGGNRGGALFRYRNLLLTMVIGGLWHGASYNFVIWGTLHGGALVLHSLWSGRSQKRFVCPPFLGWILCFSFVCFGFVVFRFTKMALLGDWIVQVVGLRSGQEISGGNLWWAMLCLLAALHFSMRRRQEDINEWIDRLSPEIQSIAYGVATFLLLFFTPLKVTPFIYFQF